MKHLLAAAILGLTLLVGGVAGAAPFYLYKYIEHPEPVGSGTLNFLVWNVYTATLFAPFGDWRQDAPYALHIRYHMDLAGEDITDRSIEEMRRQGLADQETIDLFRDRMAAIFPDVTDDTTLTGIRDNSGKTLFYENGQLIGDIREPEFAERFFAIWLSPETSEPRLRRRLLGEN
jgi:hypothetical protein